jgi:hypothetical protein
MTTSTLRKKLADYIQVADTKKVKAIYALVENEISGNDDNELGIDTELMLELTRHSSEMKNGANSISITASDLDIEKLLNQNK